MGVRRQLFYEIEGANRALPLVRAIVRDVVSEFRVLRGTGRQYRALRAKQHPDAVTRQRIEKLRREVDRITTRVEGFVRELDDLGIALRNVETGSVDFPTIMHGLPAYLCWRLGENDVGWWHAATAGYASRQRLPEETRASV